MDTTNTPVIVEQVYKTTVGKVWSALTDNDEMKLWYFNLKEFIPETGFEFTFSGGPDGREYKHICTIMEVSEAKKISYTWRYEGYEGNSLVTFELFEEKSGNDPLTRLRVTHSGLDSFPKNNPDFAKSNFEEGWKQILGITLKKYLEEINN